MATKERSARLKQFLGGHLTLGTLEGITKKAQYGIAEKAHRLLEIGAIARARQLFEGLLALDPRDAYFHLALGSIAMREERFQVAEKFFSRALQYNPTSAVALANRGELLARRGKLREAANDLAQAVRLDPKRQLPSTQRAAILASVLLKQLNAAKPPKKPSRSAKAPPAVSRKG